jgi:acyl transferase domain-containing protein
VGADEDGHAIAVGADDARSPGADDERLLEYLKRATIDLRQSRRRVQELEERGREPVAIVGMGCRFPGGVGSPEELWGLVVEGRDAVGAFPDDRGWDLAGLFDPDPDRAGSCYVREGGFLGGAGEFDAGLFKISPREALAVDPQQRQLLEVCWEALERAGIDPVSLRGSDTGVFAGVMYQDYGVVPRGSVPADLEGYLGIGSGGSVASGRVSYVLGLEGPAVSVDTACSSSLVAVHLACGALRGGECSLALAGGVTVLATPSVFVEFSRQRGVSPDGRCKSFADAADGTGWGEGVGVLVLERLSDARRNGHRVLGVVRGSAVNQDGASNGLTAPSGLAQQRLILRALECAGLGVGEVDVVEGHGTGTALGDPIEAQALLATYGRGRAGAPLWLGSVKSNVGHTQAAAGVAGVIKMVMALRHGVLPRSLHVDRPSSQVDWGAGEVALLTEEVPWPRGERPRRAGVSSFGVSGTNAHLILEEPPAQDGSASASRAPASPACAACPLEVVPWVVSGRGAGALRAQAGRLRELVAGDPDLDVRDVGLSLAGRPMLEDRAVVLGGDRAALLAGLDALAHGRRGADAIAGVTHGGSTASVAFLFTGQGAQRAGMGRELYESQPAFRSAFEEVCAQLEEHLGEPLRELVLAGKEPAGQASAARAGPLDGTELAQPALFALEVALYRLLEGWGVRPDFLIGHSVGELVAAHVAGVFSLEDACRLVAARGRLMGALPPGGAMVAIAATEEEVAESLTGLEGWRERVALAAVNAPGAVVVSGDEPAVAELAELWQGRGRKIKRLRVSHAFHSPRMDAMLEEFERLARSVSFERPRIPIVSNVTGSVAAGEELCTAAYWARHVRETVRFAEGVRWLREAGVRCFLELGPDGVLSTLVHECAERAGERDERLAVTAAPLLREGHEEARSLLAGLGEIWARGAKVDWARLFEGSGAARVELPTYAFQREHYWLRASPGAANAAEAGFWRAVETGDAGTLAQALALGDEQGRASLESVLPALATWHRSGAERSTMDGWRYRVGWRQVRDLECPPLSGAWLVAAPAGGCDSVLLESVLEGLRARGAQPRVVEVAGVEADRDELAARLRADAAEDAAVGGVVSLLALGWGGDPASEEGADGGASGGGGRDGLTGTLVLAQALRDAGVAAPLWCVSAGAVAIDGEERVASPFAGLVWGLGRVLGLEEPERWGGIVDLPAERDRLTCARLCEVLGGAGERELAVRAGGVFARRLLSAPLGMRRPEGEYAPTGTVLVTGGTGALGGHLARWLAQGGAEHILLSSRRGLDAPGAVELAAELEQLGTRVSVAACDVGDRAQLERLLASVPAQLPLSAVFHAAGVLDDGLVEGLTPERLEGVLAPKADAAWHLHELTEEMDLSAFVLFSSIAGTLGGGGQGAYAAANAFLDALAEHRRGRGLAGVSVAWGPWAGEGMTAGVSERLRRAGARAMPVEPALAGLGAALEHGDACVMLADMDWERVVAGDELAGGAEMLCELAQAREALAARRAQEQTAGGLAASVAGLGERERARAVLELVRSEVAAVLGHPSPDAVPSRRTFKDLGFDSLSAVRLRNRLAAVSGLRLASGLVFDYPTPLELAEHLSGELAGAPGPGREASAPAVSITAGRARASAPADEPIAIVGMGCRYPGGVRSPEELWELVAQGRDAISPFPADRGWDLEGLYDADPDREGTSYVREGGFLEDAGDFDAPFFGIGPREALAMDPQQRLLLEVCWEALEDAGVDPLALRGSQGGVFAGISMRDYGGGLPGPGAGELEGYLSTGRAGSVVSGRVAYTLGLEGPAVTVDTACSSSLVALHLACQSLRAGECTLALAAGVTVMATPGVFVDFARQRGLSPDGRCKAFANAADGTGWGEGVGVLLLEGLSRARAAGRPVLAVVRGSAINQDGASNGLTAPNGPSQQRVIERALAVAGVAPGEVDAVEAHGTGTTLGDPIEARALMAVYGRDRPPDRPLWLGAIKSNIGHTQAAAGIAGAIKLVMSLQREQLARTLHVDEPSCEVDWSGGALSLLSESRPWRANGRPRRAAVSAFGLSGTNAHVILEEAPAPEPMSTLGTAPEAAPAGGPPVLRGAAVLPWVLSGRGEGALSAQARRLEQFLGSGGELEGADVALSLARRAALEERAVVVGETREELLDGLRTLADGGSAEGAERGAAVEGGIAFMFPGQGSQWQGMAVELLDSSPAFAGWIERCADALAPLVGWRVEDVLRGAPGAPGLERVEVVQPALFAMMVSLAGLWRACGVHPDAVVGHSQGEIAAAQVAGGLTLEDAARVVALRSRALASLAGRGGMVALALGAREAAPLLERCGEIALAAVNGPGSIVVSGERQGLERLLEACAREGVRARRIAVDYAAHSAQVEAIREELLEGCAEIVPRSAEIPFYSTVTGGVLDTARLDAEYWYRNLRETVDFRRATAELLGAGQRTLIEVSPHPVLVVGAQETIDERSSSREDGSSRRESAQGRSGAEAMELACADIAAIGSLRREEGGPRRWLSALAEAWVRGAQVDWGAVLRGAGGRTTKLPTYAFQRERYWLEPAIEAIDGSAAASRARGGRPADEQGGEADERSADEHRETDERAADEHDRKAGARAPAGGALLDRLDGVPAAERERVVLELVRSEAATVLGLASASAVQPRSTFRKLGFDSLTGLQLSRRLRGATGLRLPVTVIFDYPTPVSLAGYLLDELLDRPGAAGARAVGVAAVDEPVAIVGMGCRFPGGVRTPRELWELIASERDAIAGFPTDRGWDLERLYDPDPDHPGTCYVREGGFLYDAGEFDAAFFGISPREALAMDPQQRLLLEVCWETVEDAGIDPSALQGARAGVFAGVGYSGYGIGSREDGLDGYRLTGSLASVISGRVAYTLGLVGPAVSIDTACSSSLVALHLACNALRQGECSLALAGGVTVMATPEPFVEFARQRGLAWDGRCKAFSDDADGTGWAEGVGVVLLERLGDARRNGREVLGVIRGSAVNQDGASNGLTAPNGPSQQRVVLQALANAGLEPDEVDAVEAHGTGTTLGDPIEAQALLATYGWERDAAPPLWLGSVKSNIGHTGSAAGVAGVIKMAMALKHERLPRTLHVQEPSGKVDWERGAVSVLTEALPWRRGERPRRAGISSFGVSGTNAHVILEEAPPAQRPPVATEVGGQDRAPALGAEHAEERAFVECALPWVLSGRGAAGLRGQAGRLGELLVEEADHGVLDVGLSLAGRMELEDRAVVSGGDRGELLAGLGALARGESHVGVVRGAAVGGGVGFVFPGQGSQWAGMAVELLDRSPAFAAAMRECEAAFGGLVDWSLESVLRGGEGEPSLERVDVVQPALFAVMVSLARLWSACGVRPDAVVGHSQGEIAAVCACGGLSLQDAARLVVARARALGRLGGLGGMVSVAAGAEWMQERLGALGGGVSVAAVNGPGSVVVSGAPDALERVLGLCESEGVRSRRIPVDYAAHGEQVEAIREELLQACASLAPQPSEVPFYSSVTGGALDTAALDAEYWYRNLREVVRFDRAAAALWEAGCRTFVEASPHPVLAGAVAEVLEGGLREDDRSGAAGRAAASAGAADAGAGAPGASASAGAVVGSLRRGEGVARFLRSLGEAWVRGVGVDWRAVFAGRGARRVALPSYAFQRERYWLRAGGRGAVDLAAAGQAPAEHPLLGAAVALADGEGWLFTGRLSLESDPWLADHGVTGVALLAGTAFVELALYAGRQAECEVVRELALEAPLVLGEGEGVQLQVIVGAPDEDGCRALGVYSRLAEDDAASPGEWTRNASGTLAPGARTDAGEVVDAGEALGGAVAGEWPPEGAAELEVDGLYERLTAEGYEYAPAFRCLRRAWRRGEDLFAEVSLSAEQGDRSGAFCLHPALLDSAMHTIAAGGLGQTGSERPLLPFSWGDVSLATLGARSLRAHVRVLEDGVVSLRAFDERGMPIASVGSLTLRPASAAQLGAGRAGDGLLRVDWVLVPPGPDAPARFAVLGAAESVAASGLRQAGAELDAHEDLASLVRAIQQGAPVPELVLVDLVDVVATPAGEAVEATGEAVEAAGACVGRVLELVRGWLAEERLADARLVLASSGAVAAGAGELAGDLGGAAAWGLVRSAQTEHPGRFVLVDLDRAPASWQALMGAVRCGEPQLALRAGALLAPRLAPVAGAPQAQAATGETPSQREGERGALPAGAPTGGAPTASTRSPASSPATPGPGEWGGTALVTGGTGGLGRVLARHLVLERGVRCLLLASRRGPRAPGAQELEEELRELGAQVRVRACDVADREQVRALLGEVPAEHPLSVVVHAAGVLDDGVVDALTPERLERVWAPKAEGAWHLHELTRELDLRAFVLFSSVAAVFGSPAQANYAAANAFMDALAAHRRELGLPAISLGWGYWERATEMTGGMEGSDRARITRMGMHGISPEDGMSLFDRAVELPQAHVLPIRPDRAALRRWASTGELPALLSGIAGAPARRSRSAPRRALAQRLAGVPDAEREGVVLELVCAEAATVLGHASARAIDPDRPFKELGFDSLTAVELRNRLVAATDVRLAVAVIFDLPTPAALSAHIAGAMKSGGAQATPSASVELDRLEAALSSLSAENAERAAIMVRLQTLLDGWSDSDGEPGSSTSAYDLDSASDEEMFELINSELEGADNGRLAGG